MAAAAFKLLKCLSAVTETDVSKLPNYLSSNVVGAVGSHPIAVPQNPADPDNYSFDVWLKFECTTAPDNYTQNFKVFGPAFQPDNDPKLTVYFGTTATFVTPVETASTVATTRQDTNYYSSGTALAIGVIPGDSKIDAIGEQTQYIVQQLKVEYGAGSGEIPLQAYTLQYEET